MAELVAVVEDEARGLLKVAVEDRHAQRVGLGLLAACCKLGSVQGCRELLKAGAAPNAVDKDNWSAPIDSSCI